MVSPFKKLPDQSLFIHFEICGNGVENTVECANPQWLVLWNSNMMLSTFEV